MKKNILIVLISATLLVLVLLLVSHGTRRGSADYQTKNISIASHQIQAYLADTEQKQQTGLAAFDKINQNRGMVFYFATPDKYAFWMKDMKFAIDIIWIRDNKIVDISQNIQTETGKSDNKLTKYYPASEVDTVLEVNTGWANKNKIRVGESIN